MTTQKYRIIKLLYALALFQFSYSFLTPLWAILAHHVNGTVAVAGIAIGVLNISQAICTMPACYVIEKLGMNKMAYIVSCFICSIIFLSYIWIKMPWQLYLIQFLLAFFYCVQSPAFNSMYQSKISPEIAPVAWGADNTVYCIAYGLGAVASAHLFTFLGYNAVFIVMSILACISGFISMAVLPSDSP